MSITKPPPCAQACWEWVPTRRPGTPRTWAYTGSAKACGHHYDHDDRLWRWDTRP